MVVQHRSQSRARPGSPKWVLDRREVRAFDAFPLAARIASDQNSHVNALLTGLDALAIVARVTFLGVAIVAAAVCVADWAVRTRRISPFSGTARFFRNAIDPLMAPIERRVVRSGGIPSNAPWWALAAVVVGGILVLWLLAFVRGQVSAVAFASATGGRGIVRLLVSWIFAILQIALFVRVIASWIRVSPYSRWLRWAYVLTEPMLAPLRRFIPPIGGTIDITPLIAYFVLSLVSGWIVSRL